jgi:MFS family permease
VILLIYYQIRQFNKAAWSEFHLESTGALILALGLVYLNIWIAYLQWKVTLNVVVPNTILNIRIQSFFAGIVTGIVTPNMVGNFIGRLYYFERRNRIAIILFTLLSNYAQFLASLVFGWIAILIVGDLYVLPHSESIIFILGFGVILAFLAYFFIDNFLSRFKKKKYFNSFREILKKNRTYRSTILGLSLLRFFVFTMQFSLMLYAFGETINVSVVMAIWQVYLLTMLIPSVFLGKIGVRESVALFVLVNLGMNEFAILFSSLIIWGINTLLPALVGLIVCKNRENV